MLIAKSLKKFLYPENYWLIFLHFNMTFLAIWGCASNFLKILPKFEMATRGQPQTILWTQKLKSEIIQILLSHPPPYGDVQVTFSRFY